MSYQAIQLNRYPEGMPIATDFEQVEISLPTLKDGEVLIQNQWMSVDPYMRGRMTLRKSYVPPFSLHAPLDGGAIGVVIESRHTALPIGMQVSHFQGWRSHAVAKFEDVLPLPQLALPEEAFLGVLGMPGMTAWTGLFRIAHLQKGETVFVSAASGAVGSIVCQLAKQLGCTVIASVGSEEKAQYLRDLGIDHVINYKESQDLTADLTKVSPNGIDVYFENVGGDHLEAALSNMNPFGRIAVCGMISQYNETKASVSPHNLSELVVKKLTMQGFIVTDHWDHYPEFCQHIIPLLQSKVIQWQETVYDGLSEAPNAFIGLFEGKNIGKMLVKLS
jgi:hypothetical protein